MKKTRIYKFRNPKFNRHFTVRAKVKQRKLNRLVKAVKVLTLFVVVLAVVIFISKTIHRFVLSKFEIKYIEIEGLSSIPKEKFLTLLPVKLKNNLVGTYFTGITKKISTLIPEVKSVRIKREFPDRIIFIVTERKPVAAVEIGKKLIGIDEDNVLFETNRDLSQLPQIVIDSYTTGKAISWISNAIKLLTVINEKNEKIYLLISKLYNINSMFTLLLKSNTKVFWTDCNDNISTQLELLSKTLEFAEQSFKNIEYIDLRLYNEGRIILKPTDRL